MGKQFLLPDELGWKCNDELNAYFYKWVERYSKAFKRLDWLPADVAVAELMDNWYAIIKKHQKRVKLDKLKKLAKSIREDERPTNSNTGETHG